MRLRPEDVGLASATLPRRVAGLRREELASLAGIGTSYYTRLEQGQRLNPSDAVLNALASALRLSADEHAHLLELGQRGTPRRESESASPMLLGLLDTMSDVPMLVTGSHGDVLAWNRLAHAVFAAHLDPESPGDASTRPNIARLVFLDPRTRLLFADWGQKARAVVEHLRLSWGRDPSNGGTAALVEELAAASAAFAKLWAEHGVGRCDQATYALNHSRVGNIELTQQTLQPVRASDQSIVVFTTESGSKSAAAIRYLRAA